MQRFESGGNIVEFDREATAAVYAQIKHGDATRCQCSACHNFSLQRLAAYPEPLKALLLQFGIDPLKEDEVYEMGEDPPGLRIYGGWFHFVGRLICSAEPQFLGNAQFSFGPRAAAPKPPQEFGDAPVAVVEFLVRIPWISDRPPDEPFPAAIK